MTVSDTAASLGAALASRYTIERELGRGGMATVYLAEDLKLHRRVALKVLHLELGATLGPERFLREIDIASRLTHPHILALHNSGEAAGRLFYAMPYVEGESLRQRLQREPQLPIEETVGIVRAVASALDYAHHAGVIHRDIKPENILLARDPTGGPAQPLVADFGIARALDAAGSVRLTETGLALGTPAYMSPEQAAANSRLDGRSDLYALGCVAYEMLAGTPPFTGTSAQAILARHAVDPVPPLRTVRATVPEPVAGAIERALAKVPADRFATAAEFAEALVAGDGRRQWLGRRLSSRRVGLALAACVGVIAAGVGFRKVREGASSPVVPSAATIAVLPLSSGDGDTSLIRLGRDLAVTISASLDGVGGLATADRLRVAKETRDARALSPADGAALARRLGANSVMRGTLVQAGNQVRLDVGLYDAGSLAPLADGISFTAHRDSLGPLTDSVAWALLAAIWRHGEPPTPSLAAVTTRSLPSLRAFLDGEEALGANRWDEARIAFRSAIAADSTFWLAYFRYALAEFWQLQPVVEPAITQALRLHRQQLPERERALVEAFLTSWDSTDLKIERYRIVTERFPAYWPGWFLYGDALYHFGSERGYAWTEAHEAFRRAVVLDPELAPAWEHILDLTLGKDRDEAARAAERVESGMPALRKRFYRLLLEIDRSGGVIPPGAVGLADSMAANMASPAGETSLQAGILGLRLLQNGFPAAQLDMNYRGLRSNRLPPQVRTGLEAANAWAWAARGRWDSALTISDRVALRHPGVIGPVRTEGLASFGGFPLAAVGYEIAVIGAWLGATAPAEAGRRRQRAVSAVAQLADEGGRRDGRGRIAWLDGLLGLASSDRDAIQAARRDAARSGYSLATNVDRSLAAFDQALAGDPGRAGRELAVLDLECLNHMESCNLFTPHIAVHRLAAAQWLAEAGDVERARRLLRWHDAEATYFPGSFWALIYTLGAPTYLARARLEEAGGDPRDARAYYRQFLHRYDRPMASQVHLVDEAKAALAHLETDR